MADLDFSHHVSEIPRGEELPKPYQRQVGVEVTQLPDMQNAVSKFASDTNWMSALGSQVASTASSALASKLGGESGKNPHGDIGIALTDFDKNFKQSYDTQAQATLSVQAQKLISDSNIELAKQPRLSVGMIQNAQAGVGKSLQKIFANAPDSVRPNLEHQYSSVMIQQNETLVKSMISQQREDMRDNTAASTKVYAQNAHSLAMGGDDKGAMAAVHSTEKDADNAYANRVWTKQEAQAAKNSARISMLAGRETRKAQIAESKGKLPEFYKDLIDHPPKDISDADHVAVLNNVAQYMNQQEAFKLRDQQLEIAKYNVKLAEDPLAAAADFPALQANLTPVQAQQAKLALVQALNKKNNSQQAQNTLIANWGSSDVFARAKPEDINATFDSQWQKLVNDRSSPMSPEQAQATVAARAGGQIPVFTKSIHDKLSSGNPQQMESGGQIIHSLYEMGAAHALDGLTEKDKAAFEAIDALRGSLDPTKAMVEATNNIYNQKKEVTDQATYAWAHKMLHLQNIEGVPPLQYALDTFIPNSQFTNGWIKQQYAADLLEQYHINFNLQGGNDVAAISQTVRYAQQNYGSSWVNGSEAVMKHPIEKTLGFSDSSVVPTIHKDFVRQVSPRFAEVKAAFDAGTTNEYWDIESISPERKRGQYFNTPQPIKVMKYSREKTGAISKASFNVVLQGNSFDGWDINVDDNGMTKPLVQIAPFMGYIEYKPDKQWINDEYLGNYHNFPEEQLSAKLSPYLSGNEEKTG